MLIDTPHGQNTRRYQSNTSAYPQPPPFNLHADLQTFFWVLHFSALSAVIFPCNFLYSSTANHKESVHRILCFGAL